jgi:hypothetical protein
MDLKALSFLKNVIRTPETDKVIEKLDNYFVKAGLKRYITSVKRSPLDQIGIIEGYAKQKGLMHITESMEGEYPFEGSQYPKWQVMWSQLLSKGLLINPPYPAKVLTDYYKNGVNQKGVMKNPSGHFTGKCFDIGGSDNVQKTYDIVNQAKNDGIGIVLVILERENNCVHSQVI